MYITDWRLDAIVKLHKLTGEQEEILVREPQTNRLYGVKVFSHEVQMVSPYPHPCTNHGCEKLCFVVPRIVDGQPQSQLIVSIFFLNIN